MKSLISLSFDDGRMDNYNIVYPILKKYNLPATFNITTGYILGKIKAEDLCPEEPMTIEMVRELFADSQMEIAGHGYYHLNTFDDIKTGITELCKLLGVESLCGSGNGFASPGTALNIDNYLSKQNEFAAAGIKYVRLSLRYQNLPNFKTLMRKLARVVKHPAFLYRIAYQDTLMNSICNNLIYSIPVLADGTLAQIKSLIFYALRHAKSCVLMLHSIVPDGQVRDNWDFEVSKFERLCAFLAEYRNAGKLDIVTTMSLYESLKKNK